MTEKHDWKLPQRPENAEAPEKPKTLRIVLANPRPSPLYTLRPCEALIWDALSRGTREYVDVIPGQFLGLPVNLLGECLGNLAALHLLSGEGITPTRQPFQFSQDVELKGKVRQAQDSADKRAKEAAQKQAGKEPTHEPWGFSLPPTVHNTPA